MDLIYGLHDAINPLPLITASFSSGHVRMAMIKVLGVTLLFSFFLRVGSDYITSTFAIGKALTSALDTLTQMAFSIVPPLLSSTFKADCIRHLKIKEERSAVRVRKQSIFDTIEKFIYLGIVNVFGSLLSLTPRYGYLFKLFFGSILTGYYILEPRWLADGLSFRKMFSILETRWLYFIGLGMVPVLVYRHNNLNDAMLIISIWQISSMWNGWKRAGIFFKLTGGTTGQHGTTAQQPQPKYPKLPLFALQSRGTQVIRAFILKARPKKQRVD